MNKMQHLTLTGKNHRVISIEIAKWYDKIQRLFMMKALKNLGIEGTST
jgi:hypothetical protein